VRLQGDCVTTVRDVLALELIRAAEPTVVCGEHALDRPVRWVHVGEIPDIARFLVGGEVVLTAGLGIGFTEHEQAGYIASLAQAGIAALVIEVAGRAFRELPAALIRAGREADLPIIAVAREFPFEAVTAELHRRIVNERVDLLEAVERISRRFGELVANGGDYAAIVAVLAELAGAPVVLENSARQVRTYAGGDAESDDLLSAWDAHSRARHAEQGDRCLRVPVLLRGEPWGYLHVLHNGGRPAPAVLPYAAERAATFIAIALLNDRVARARGTLRQTALLHRLLDGELSGPEFVKLALTLGTDLRSGPMVGVALAPDPAEVPGGMAINGPEKADLVALGLRRAGFAVLAGEESDCSLLVVGLGNGRSAGDVRVALDDAGIIAGMSGEVTAERVRAAVQQARRAFDVAASGIKGPVLAAGDLGIYGLLAELAEGTQLAQFVENELGPLMSRDAAADRGLLPTLSVYVDTGFNKAESAARLHIQRRTFYYRLDKIAAALGRDLDSPDNRIRLHVALAGLRLLRARAARVRGG
jgi:PucR family transcriptional regulator, purine catabolism regulatory protein